MYRVYVIRQRKAGRSEVQTSTRTETPFLAAAQAAFNALQAMPYSAEHLLLMTHDRRQIYAYRYESEPGDPDYLPPGVVLDELKSPE